MPVYIQPLGLQQLAIQEIADFVVQSMTSEILQTSYLHKMRTRLKGMLQDAIPRHFERSYYHTMRTYLKQIPRSFANDLTSEILIKLGDHEPHLREALGNSLVQLCFQDILNSLIHPKLTELAISSRWKYIVPFVAKNMCSFSNLEVLIYSHHNNRLVNEEEEKQIMALTTKALKTLVHLRTFIFHKICDDKIIKRLCKNCKNLKCLDIKWSECVTDASIDSILKLSNLEEINIYATSIKYEGEMDLLKGFSENNIKLKSFGCTTLSEEHLDILSSNFSELTELSSEVELSKNSTVHSVNFSKLKSLSILNYNPEGFEIFQPVAAHLVKLVLASHSMNVSSVIKNCPSLKNLSIITDYLVIEDCPYPCLSSLQHLTLHTRDSSAATTLLSQCKNLTSLELCVQRLFFNSHLEILMMDNEFRHLEEINLGALRGIVPPEAVILVTQRCCSIKVFRVCGYDPEKLRNLYKNYHGIEIDPELWFKLREHVVFKMQRYGVTSMCRFVGYNRLDIEQ